MSVGNLKTQGNQGNNLPYQLRSLQLLGEISVNTSGGGGGGGGTTTAFSTLVRDAALDLYIEVRVWDSATNNWVGSPAYYAVGDNTAATPPFPQAPITYIDYQSDITSVGNILNLVLNTLSTTRTPYVLLASGGSATISPAVLNISFYNSGASAGTITVNGVTVAIPAGVTFNYDAGGNGNKYPANAFGYNATGTTIYVTYTA